MTLNAKDAQAAVESFLEHQDEFLDHPYCGKLEPILSAAYIYMKLISNMEIKIKKLDKNAVIPKYSKYGDAGMDLVATSVDYSNEYYIEYGTGLAIEIPEGYVGYIFPRSSNSKYDLQLCNSVGIIDSKL